MTQGLKAGYVPSEIEHGTYAGWNQHQRRAVPVCEACRKAQVVYHRAYRARMAAAGMRVQ